MCNNNRDIQIFAMMETSARKISSYDLFIGIVTNTEIKEDEIMVACMGTEGGSGLADIQKMRIQITTSNGIEEQLIPVCTDKAMIEEIKKLGYTKYKFR